MIIKIGVAVAAAGLVYLVQVLVGVDRINDFVNQPIVRLLGDLGFIGYGFYIGYLWPRK